MPHPQQKLRRDEPMLLRAGRKSPHNVEESSNKLASAASGRSTMRAVKATLLITAALFGSALTFNAASAADAAASAAGGTAGAAPEPQAQQSMGPAAPADQAEGVPRQSRPARRVARRRDRHHRRPRLRLPALQDLRLPAAQGSGADVRRRPAAEPHHRDPRRARGAVHEGHVLLRRQGRRRLPRDPARRRQGRPHHRRPHRQPQRPLEDEVRRGQGRDRALVQHRSPRGRRPDGAVLPLPLPAAIRRSC